MTGQRGAPATAGRQSSWPRLNGDTEIADYLLAQGAAPPGPDPVHELIAAAFRADRSTLDRVRAEHPDAVAEARHSRAGLIVWAATQAPTETVTLLAELGFDINAYGRGDAPVEEAWETALHHSAANGNVELTRRLLDLGADPNLRDRRFDAHATGLGPALPPAVNRRAARTRDSAPTERRMSTGPG